MTHSEPSSGEPVADLGIDNALDPEGAPLPVTPETKLAVESAISDTHEMATGAIEAIANPGEVAATKAADPKTGESMDGWDWAGPRKGSNGKTIRRGW